MPDICVTRTLNYEDKIWGQVLLSREDNYGVKYLWFGQKSAFLWEDRPVQL